MEPMRDPLVNPGWPSARLLVLAVVLACTANLLRLQPVPHNSETLYLLLPELLTHAGALTSDWTISSGFPEHATYDRAVALALQVVPPILLGWLGRFVASILSCVTLVMLGRQLRLSLPLTALGMLLWLLSGQGLYRLGNEWMMGTFEAKTFAYPLVIAGLLAVMQRRWTIGGVLAGCAFTIHPAVGLWGGLGVLGAMFALQGGFPAFLRIAGGGLLASLPGAILLVPGLLGHGGPPTDWAFLVHFGIPQHIDVSRFNRTSLIQAFVLAAFVGIELRRHRDHVADRALLGFMVVQFLVFLAGLTAFAAGAFGMLQYMPFRVYPMLIPLIFLWLLLRAFSDGSLCRTRPLPAALALGGLLLWAPAPTTHLVESITDVREAWTDERRNDAYRQAFRWLTDHARPDDVAILPPHRDDSFYYARVPQIANRHAIPYGAINEWHDRLEHLVGPISSLAAPYGSQELEAAFKQRTESDVLGMAVTYRATVIVTSADYPGFPVLFAADSIKVYRIVGDATSPAL